MRPWMWSVLLVGCIFVLPAAAQQLDTVLYFPDSLGFCHLPNTVFANPLTGRVYVANGGDVSGTLIFDPASRTKYGFVRSYHHGAVFCPGAQPKVYLFGEYEMTVMDAQTDRVLRTVSTEFYATQGFYNAHNGRLYFSDPDNQAVAVFDPAVETLVGEIDVDVTPLSVVYDPVANRIFCAGERECVAVVDCYGDTLLAQVTVTQGLVTELALDSGGRRVYLAATPDTLYVLHPDSLTVVGAVGGLYLIQLMLFNPVLGRLYFMSLDSLVIYDCGAGTIRKKLRQEDYTYAVCRNDQSGCVYLAVGDPSRLLVIDAGDTVAATVNTAAMGLPAVLGYGSGRNELYCAMRDDTIAIVDGRADTLAGFMDYTQSVIRGVVHNPVENKLYLVLPDRGEVWVLDRDYRLAATISVPMRRLSVFPLFNPGLNRLYLADSELLWVIDCASDSLLGGRTVTGFEQASTALLVQSLGKVYIFPRYVTGQYGAWVYDCLRDTVTAFILLPHRVVSAGYHQWSHCVYASVYNDSSVVVIDAAADTVVAKLRAGRRSSSNKVCANPLNGMVYHAINTGAEKLVSIDVRTNAVVDSVEIGDDADTIFWYPRHNKLYLCDRVTTSYVKVFDCNTGRVTATLPLPCGYAGALNEATERLYLGDAETLLVLDCRTDEVVGSVPLPSPARLSAVNMIDSRVYFADRSNWVAVIQDRLGVEEEERARGRFGFALASNPVRSRALFRYQLAPGEQAELLVYDACGRRVNRIAVIGSGRPQQLVWGRTDASGRAVAAGVYFAVLGAQGGTARVKVVVE